MQAEQLAVFRRVSGDRDEAGVPEELNVEQAIFAPTIRVLLGRIGVVFARLQVAEHERPDAATGRRDFCVGAGYDVGHLAVDPAVRDAVVEVQRDDAIARERGETEAGVATSLLRGDSLLVGRQVGAVRLRPL